MRIIKAFYGSRFSKNMTMTPEGFLICHNTPVARTGWYEYLGKELGLTNKKDEIIKVYRGQEEVFSEKAIASFEGKIVTDEHPPNLLTPENAQRYAKGTMQNVRQGKEESDLLLADLMIYDKRLIEEIQEGKREVSCGYDCIYIDNKDGTFSQKQICGNHVAVVEAGRAGSRVAIKDSNKEVEENKVSNKIRIPKKTSTTTKFLAALGLKHFAMDAEPAEIADVVDEMAEESKAEDGIEEIQQEKKPEVPSNDEGGNPEIAALSQQVALLTELVMQAVKPKEQAPEDAIDELIKEIGTGDGEGSETVEMDEDIPGAEVSNPEDRPENPIPGADSLAMVKALRAMKPIIASIPDESARKKACDSLVAEFRKAKQTPDNTNGYANILKAQKKTANDKKEKQQTADERANYIENLGESIAKKYNANLKGGN